MSLVRDQLIPRYISPVFPCLIMTREAGKNDRMKYELESILSDSIDIVEIPSIETILTRDYNELLKLAHSLHLFDAIILTSPESAKIFLSTIDKNEIRIQCKIFCVGDGTAQYIRERLPQQEIYISTRSNAESLTREIQSKRGSKYLFATSVNSEASLYTSLTRAGLDVTLLRTYKTVTRKWSQAEHHTIEKCFNRKKPIIFLLASPSTAHSLKENMTEEQIMASKVACIGSTTAYAAEKINFGKIYVAEDPSLKGLLKVTVEAIDDTNAENAPWMKAYTSSNSSVKRMRF